MLIGKDALLENLKDLARIVVKSLLEFIKKLYYSLNIFRNNLGAELLKFNDNETFKILTNAELKYPRGELTLRDKTWTEILDHNYFSKQLVESWKKTNVPPRCIRVCGAIKREQEQNVKVEL